MISLLRHLSLGVRGVEVSEAICLLQQLHGIGVYRWSVDNPRNCTPRLRLWVMDSVPWHAVFSCGLRSGRVLVEVDSGKNGSGFHSGIVVMDGFGSEEDDNTVEGLERCSLTLGR